MKKFEFNMTNLPCQAKELLLVLRELNASGKKYTIITHISLNDKVPEKTVIQIIGDPSYYHGLMNYFISRGLGRIEYLSPKSKNQEHIKMITIEES